MYGTIEEQKVRIFLCLIVCGVLRYLSTLADLSKVHTYDYTEYCGLLSCVRTTCRHMDDDAHIPIFGPWKLIELRACLSTLFNVVTMI